MRSCGYQNVEIVPAAAGDSNGSISLWRSATNFANHALNAGLVPNVQDSVQVDVVTVDELCAARLGDRRPAVLKIDVEGWEWEVLQGARQVLDRARPTIWLEYWPDGIRANGHEPGDVLDLFDEYGYSVSAHDLVIESPVALTGREIIDYCDEASRALQGGGPVRAARHPLPARHAGPVPCSRQADRRPALESGSGRTTARRDARTERAGDGGIPLLGRGLRLVVAHRRGARRHAALERQGARPGAGVRCGCADLRHRVPARRRRVPGGRPLAADRRAGRGRAGLLLRRPRRGAVGDQGRRDGGAVAGPRRTARRHPRTGRSSASTCPTATASRSPC